ncbi:ZIP zinc transporter [Solemya pervernicosa gill symbiont]|uniref:ZIP zinc transporter n=2 Tax=Gammaproteobacteria incertae sedis TaxID=118884 RepID=A0A1T2L614_9GAMM|nr:ZIP family metal transporter [Candidatus Reidiella endopervernicosa]OOZ40523.1 ZIP zinc transporter [Solemya pervernicosa gill symbiont]QKQ27509.1 ZIP family metal transporter [Candidatus Reidiella endopervernicosa]
MTLLLWILLFCLLGGVLSVAAVGTFLLFSESLRTRLLPHLVSFATGALLGAAFLALLPHALEGPGIDDFHELMMAVLLGLLAFFILEKMVLWRHCHTDHCEAHAPHSGHGEGKAASLILIGDGLHNFVDGVLIAAAFMTDFHLGVVTSVAIAAHEIPQEVGDFAILLHSGFSRRKAFFFNLLSSFTTILGGLLAWFSLQNLEFALPYVLAVAASSFIYIAVADLIPGLHQRVDKKDTVYQVVLIVLGVVVIHFAHATVH